MGINQDFISVLEIFGIDIGDYVGVTFNVYKLKFSIPSICTPFNLPPLVEQCCPGVTMICFINFPKHILN